MLTGYTLILTRVFGRVLLKEPMTKIRQDGCWFSMGWDEDRSKHSPRRTGLGWLACALAAIGTAQAQTDTETVPHSFTSPARGAYPYAGVIRDSSSNLYGSTFCGEHMVKAPCSRSVRAATKRCSTASRAEPTAATPMRG